MHIAHNHQWTISRRFVEKIKIVIQINKTSTTIDDHYFIIYIYITESQIQLLHIYNYDLLNFIYKIILNKLYNLLLLMYTIFFILF